MRHTLTREDDEGNEYEILVEFTVSKYYPAVMYLSNGDPGYPEEGGEVEVSSAIRQDTMTEVELTDSEIGTLSEEWSRAYDDYDPDEDCDDIEDDREYDDPMSYDDRY